MACNYSYDELTAYFDGELDPDEAREIGFHVSRCPACSKFLNDLKIMQDMLKEAGREEVDAPPDLRVNVMSSLRSEGAFKQGGIQGIVSGMKRYRLVQKGVAAAVGALLVGGATWGWVAGQIGKQLPQVARQDNPPPVSEKYTPEQIKPNGGNTPVTKDLPAESDDTSKVNHTNTGPGSQENTVSSQDPEIKVPDKLMIAQENSQIPLSPTFLSRNRVSYSGFFQVSAKNNEELLKQVQTLASKYGASTAGPDSGARILRINVSTTNYGALYEELKETLTGSRQLQNSGSTGEDLGKAYREALAELEQVLRSKEGLTPGQAEQLILLEQKESSLLKQLEELEMRARNSTILIKF